MESLTIGGLAKAAAVHVETVRYYQRRGLLREPGRPLNGIRRYVAADVAWLRFIKHAQRSGFTLDEIQALLGLRGRPACKAKPFIGGEETGPDRGENAHTDSTATRVAGVGRRVRRQYWGLLSGAGEARALKAAPSSIIVRREHPAAGCDSCDSRWASIPACSPTEGHSVGRMCKVQ